MTREQQRQLWLDGMAAVDLINHPSHYTTGGIEVIDVIEAWQLGYHLGNTVKYIARCGKKTPDPREDLQKGRWYLDRYINRLEKR